MDPRACECERCGEWAIVRWPHKLMAAFVVSAACLISLALLTLTGCGEAPAPPTNKGSAPFSAVPSAAPVAETEPENVIVAEAYWLNTVTGVRHNKKCRWYGMTKGGRLCRADEGTPCDRCGG